MRSSLPKLAERDLLLQTLDRPGHTARQQQPGASRQQQVFVDRRDGVARRKIDELLAPAVEERIVAELQCARPLSSQRCEGAADLCFASGGEKVAGKRWISFPTALAAAGASCASAPAPGPAGSSGTATERAIGRSPHSSPVFETYRSEVDGSSVSPAGQSRIAHRLSRMTGAQIAID